MGLNLEQVTKGAADIGNVLLGGVKKFNEIRREVAGVQPATSTPAINAAQASTAGTAPQQAAQAVAKGSDNTSLFLVVGLLLVLSLVPRGKSKGG